MHSNNKENGINNNLTLAYWRQEQLKQGCQEGFYV